LGAAAAVTPTADESSVAPNEEKPKKARNVTEFIFRGGCNTANLLPNKGGTGGGLERQNGL
jgi:hypothetical protein